MCVVRVGVVKVDVVAVGVVKVNVITLGVVGGGCNMVLLLLEITKRLLY